MKWKDDMEIDGYVYTLGIGLHNWYKGLNEGKLLASICKYCGTKYIPTRIYCEKCLKKIEDLEEVNDMGYIHTYTEYCSKVLVLVKFEGYEGGIFSELEGVKVRIGTKVKAVISNGTLSFKIME
jgi:Predicted nucleic-acid-binding protein containing a Zn-ribbon